MVVRNGVETQNVTSKDFDLTSASASRVLLPCRAWGEMRLEMMNAALGMMSEEELHRVYDAPYEEIVQREDVKMLFNIQRKQVRLTAHISGDTVFGRCFDARIPIVADKKEITGVLDEFFSCGSRGLGQEYADYYGKVYAEWKNQK
jgi:hypothetical protein